MPERKRVALKTELLTYAGTSDFLGVKVGTLYSWVSRRAIPFVRLGPRVVRFDRAALEAWLRSRTVAPDS